ncbi:cytochrome c oxidase assembly protein cox19 [Aspergillus brasiliensis]|uniref:Cytochrome c oxidase assembly protein cox19 n=1 Tax=Aspergillus brasiliensis TaxID=319629 RepID=A0A9W6DJL4_9EURO|nr:cytochrome c oxidase assembly protein cox19 [Aspergillus brasiliensis]
MGFGAPGGGAAPMKPTPPERGSFPLDHDGSPPLIFAQFAHQPIQSYRQRECKHLITDYLKCLKSRRGVNDDECRKLAKSYLSCRMDHNLMAPDDFKNLGLIFEKDKATSGGNAEGAEKKQ